MLSFGSDGKKDRKFSEDLQCTLQAYQDIKYGNQDEEKNIEKDLNEHEMRRLKKIHLVE